MLVLAPGTYVAADMRLVKVHQLSVDESALTGESLPVSKDHDFVGSQDTPLGDRKNMAFMGAHVTGGSGKGVVVATAKATELRQIQTMVGEAEAPETPMQKQLGSMGTQLALLSGAVFAGVFGVGMLRGFGWLEMLKSSVSLAVAAVPEGLPAVATTTLAMGIANMRKHNVSVRHLDAVESLGSVQVFCMDKTGTLTMNRMAVVAIHAGIALGLGQPMNPVQLLWINLVTDIFPGLALALEPAEPDIMRRSPRDPGEKIISNKDLGRKTFESDIIGVGTMAAYLYGLKRYGNPVVASTMAFNSLTLNELAHSLSSRSKYRNVFGGQKLSSNPHLIRVIGGMARLQAMVSTVPALRRLLGTSPLRPPDLLILAASVLLPLVVNELTKPSAPAQDGAEYAETGDSDAEFSLDREEMA